MKTEFVSNTKVRFKCVNGKLATITDYCRAFDWKVPGYLGEGFYHVQTVTGQLLIAHEEDLELA